MYVANLMSKTLKAEIACGAKWMHLSHQLLPQTHVFASRREPTWAWGEAASTTVPGPQKPESGSFLLGATMVMVMILMV